jgi:anti-sigma factor RsiW
MIPFLPDRCAIHRADLIDFANGERQGPQMAAALDHLDGCPSCEAELAGVTLAVHGLRRLARYVAGAEPSSDAATRLLARIRRRRPDPWRWRLTMAGSLVSTMLVAVLVGGTVLPSWSAELQPTLAPAIRLRHAVSTEQNYLNAGRFSRLPSTASTAVVSIPRQYPDGIRPSQKEVEPDEATGRPLAAS